MPRISVVLPAYNAARSIAAAVDSILRQTERDIELIVVDDGSTDDTVEILRAIDDPRLRVFRRNHRGVAAAANFGTANARAPLIARMDADDTALPDRLQLQQQLLIDGDFDAVGSQVAIVQPNGSPAAGLQRYERWINEETRTPERIAALRFVEFPVVNPTILARRAYFELGYRRNTLPEDYDLLLRAFSCGMKVGKVPQRLLVWHDTSDRLTRTDSRYTTDAFCACRREHLLTGPLAGVDRIRFWGAGQTGKPWLRWLAGQGIQILAAVEVNERKVGRTIHGVPIVRPDELPNADGIPLLIGVGSDGARALIEADLRQRHYTPGLDAWFLA